MKGITVGGSLSIKELEDQFRKCRDSREKIRWQALRLVKMGMAARKAAKIIGCNEKSVRTWVSKYNNNGIDAMRNRKPPGRRPKLSIKQIIHVEKLIQTQPPFAARWTLRLLCHEVNNAFGVSYTPAGMWFLIKKRSFVLKVPRPYNPKAKKTTQETYKKNVQIGYRQV